MSEIKLLPCPFCGSLHLELSNAHTALFWVECLDCEARQTGYFFEGPQRKNRYSYSADPQNDCEATLENLHPEYRCAAESAIESWNSRAAVEQDRAGLTEEIERLTELATRQGTQLMVNGERIREMEAQCADYRTATSKGIGEVVDAAATLRTRLAAAEAKQQSQRRPLTDHEIIKLIEIGWQNPHGSIYAGCIREFVRAIERAHGIGEQAQEKSNA